MVDSTTPQKVEELDKDTLIKEGQEFLEMREAFKRESNPDAGSAGYLISVQWVTKYKKYVHYDMLKARRMPDQQVGDHCQKFHPGSITNKDFLETNSETYLEGTGTVAGFEADFIDRYIKDDQREGMHYEVMSEKMWNYLKDKYGFDLEVKRFYQKQSQWSNWTRLETTLRNVPVMFLMGSSAVQQFKDDDLSKMINIQQLQMKPTHMYADLKKRLADVVAKQYAGEKQIKPEDIHLWRCSNKGSLVQSLEDIKKGASNLTAPGETLEGYVGSTMNFEEEEFNREIVLIEVSIDGKFLYNFTQPERVFLGDCEFCSRRKALSIICECKRVRYCSEKCRANDERFHLKDCAARADKDLQQVKSDKVADAKEGLVGLSNLGNTCFMNSSLQCLSNAFELTQFFLQDKYEFINSLAQKNPLGTEGRLVMAYARTLNEMWNSNSYCVRPDLFKRILGQYASQFEGYQQHDSHECINTILDLLGEDLYRKGKKPYVEDQDPPKGQAEEVTAHQAWHKHLVRNESIVTDLFHGQYKSTLHCQTCGRISITFDPFMTLLLPIPAAKERVRVFYVPYHIQQKPGQKYTNCQLDIMVRGTDTMQDFRNQVDKLYGFKPANYMICAVQNGKISRHWNLGSTIDNLITRNKQTTAVLYEVLPEVQSKDGQFPENPDKYDSNNGVDSEYTKLCVNQQHYEKQKYMSYSRSNSSQYQKSGGFPRLMWVNKKTNMQELHLQVFQYMRGIISRWVEWKSPNFDAESLEKPDQVKKLIEFPYRPEGWPADKAFTKEDFDAMPLADAYKMCFPAILTAAQSKTNSTGIIQGTEGDFEIESQPYELYFKNISGYYEDCLYSGERTNSDYAVPFTEAITVASLLKNLNIKSNETFFLDDYQKKGKEMIVEVCWHHTIDQGLFAFLTQASKQEQVAQDASEEKEDTSKVKLNRKKVENADVCLEDCLSELKQCETLDEDNMWYCNVCKDFVQAEKTLEVFRVPKLLILTLKRFKASKSRIGSLFGLSGGKLDTLVDFPLEGLDMTPYVLSQSQKTLNKGSLIYDCFGVSNHMGGTGGGHYTAFCKNPIKNEWYNFDDSHCSPVNNEDNIVSEMAYSLFYRLRDDHSANLAKGKVDFDNLEEKPDMDMLAKLYQQKKKEEEAEKNK